MDRHGDDSHLELPQAFLDMPRWWNEGTEWLDALPRAIRYQCAKWDLTPAGKVAHGSNAVVIPVVRAGDAFVLRLTPPDGGFLAQVRALRFWDGRGTARLVESDLGHGAMLLEHLVGPSLTDRPVDEAVAVLGRMMRRLAVPAPPDVPSTAALVQARAAELDHAWHAVHRPFDEAFLAEALGAAVALSETGGTVAVNGDLHSAQVLRGTREPWLTVDPVLLRGDIEYDLARVLWTRVDEMADASQIVEHFETVVAEACLDRARARDWVVFRTVDYWLWGLGAGLTEGCRRRSGRPPAAAGFSWRTRRSCWR